MASSSCSICKNTAGVLNRKVSEKFVRYILHEILDPIGANASYYPSGDFSLNYDYSDPGIKGDAPRLDYFMRAGSGKMTMSAIDHVRFLSALDRGLIIPKHLVETMKGKPGDRLGFDSAYKGRREITPGRTAAARVASRPARAAAARQWRSSSRATRRRTSLSTRTTTAMRTPSRRSWARRSTRP